MAGSPPIGVRSRCARLRLRGPVAKSAFARMLPGARVPAPGAGDASVAADSAG
jgi:hypothetical protein